MRQMWAALLSLASVVFAPVLPALAQDVTAPPIDAGMATYDGGASISGFASAGLIDGSYLYFRKDFQNGVGYQDGFSTVGGFVPFMMTENQGFFGQAQMFVTDVGDVGGNIGGGYRYYVESIDRVLSAYGFYDNDKSWHNFRNDQIGIGIETLGPMWDFRANGYFPLDKDSNFIGVNQLFGNPSFSGNGIFVNGTGFFEKTMGGGDFEFGFPLLDPSAFGRLRMYVGGYAYDGQKQNQAGVRGRLEAHLNQHATVGAAFMHDDVNGDLVTMSVDLRGWSRRLPEMNNRNVTNRPKMFLPVVRQYRIAHEQFVDDITTPLLGTGGAPINIVWVDNSNGGGGSGTFEDPFSSLPGTASGADYILVRRGDSTLGNPVLGGITLADGQRMYGEGFTFNFTSTGTTFGPQFAGNYSIQSLLPQWDISGNHPFLSNPGGNVVTLANNNEVGGLNIVNSAGHGITGTGINNFRLFDLNLGSPGNGNGGAGILLTNASGTGSIRNFTAHDNAGGGVIITNTSTAALTVDIEAQQFDDPNVTGGAVGVRVLANNSTVTANITNVRNTGSGIGLDLGASNGGSLTADVDEGRFDDATGDGIQATVNNATLAMTLNNITGNNAGGNGLDINILNGGVFTGTVGGDAIGDASFSDGTGNGINVIVDSSSSALGSLVFNNTTADGNGLDGLHVELTNSSVFDIAFHDGTISGNVGDNVDTDVDGSSTLDILIDPTDLSGAGQNGYRFNVVNSSTLNATFDLVTMNNNGDNGILGTLDTLGVANLNFTNISASGNGEHGMFVTALGGSTFNGDFVQAGFNGNNASAGTFDGINFVADAGTINFDLTDSFIGNTGGGNQESGLQFLVQNAGATDINILRSNLTLNDADGVLGEVHGAGSTGDISISASTISDNGDNGTHLVVDTGADLIATVSGSSTMSNNGQNGFLLDAEDAGTTASVTMSSNNQFNNNGDAGVRINATDIDDLDAIVSGSASDNTEEGIEFNADNVADANMRVIGSGTVDSNGLDGIQFNVTNGTNVTGLVTQGVSSTNNAQNGIQVNIANSTIAAGGGPLNPTVQVGGGSIDDNGANGIELNLNTVTAAVDSVRVGSTSSISNNVDDGIHVDLTNTPLNGLQIVNNFDVSGNGEHGLHVDLANSDLTNLDISGNAFDSNTDAGVEFFGDSDVSGTFDGNSMSDNGAEGVAININGTENFTATFTGNDISGNAGGGLMVNAEDTSSFALTVGGPLLTDANTFDGNTGAGLGILLNDTATGTLNVQNSSFTNTVASAGPFFVGQGLHIRQFDSSVLNSTSSIVDSTFTGNAAQGLHVHVQDFADLNGMLVDGNDFDNTGTGIEFVRLGTGNIGTLAPVVISDNTITGGANGISLVARNSNNFDSYDLSNNTITDVTGVGILLEHGFDARLGVNMNGDTITGSGGDGIQAFQTAGTVALELRRLSGTWQNLTVSDNGGDGIDLGARLGSGGALVITTSEILNNAGIGLNVTGPGLLDANTNLIQGNGSHGIAVTGAGFKGMSFNLNTIRLNEGDGLRVVNNGNNGGFDYTISANQNLIELNTQRGINVLNQGNADTTFTANQNVINSNGNEGVFILNTASTTQSANFGAALAADGSVDAIPRLDLTFNNNLIQGNGNSGTTAGTGGTGGFVLRVGSSDGRSNLPGAYQGDGGTAGSGVGIGSRRGGVVARMGTNTFSGNAGLDVYFDSFTSTVAPAATAGTWTDQNEAVRNNANDVFTVTGFTADPLARLDLFFTNNGTVEIDATNPGASYTSDESVFKSRTAAQDTNVDAGADDNGPFGSGTRVRNAQRLAFRTGLPPTLNINDGSGSGNSDDFQFSGVGLSTFRVQESGNSFIGTGFILDVGPTTGGRGVNAGDVGQNPFGGPSGIDFMPWGWSILP